MTDDANIEQLTIATAEALAILAGLLAEAAGSGKLAYHFAQSLDANNQANPNPLRDRLLSDSYRLVLTKARNHHPDDAILADLAASEFGTPQKH